MLEMSLPSFTMDQYIIEEENKKILKIRSQNFIHGAFESTRSILESKRHNQKHMMAFVGAKIRIRNLGIFHEDLVGA